MKTDTCTTHTPGPWKATVPPSSCLTTRFVEGPNGEHVCKVGHMDYSAGSQAVDLANARLIAVAPELLAELRETELNLTQTLLASSIRTSGLKLSDSARGVLERLRDRNRALLARIDDPK